MLGTDPEVFAYSRSEERIIPAYFAMGGDIDWPLPWGKAYPDGAAVEFTVKPGPHTVMPLRIHENLNTIREELNKRDLEVSLVSSGYVGDFIDLLPESYGERASLQILGCKPDYRVYDWVEEIHRPNPKTYPYRTLGCHIHVGIGDMVSDIPYTKFLTAYLDAVLGTAGVFLLRNDPTAKQRNILYGKSGTVRIKHDTQVLEYRTLPSRAVCESPEATEYFFALASMVESITRYLYNDLGYSGLYAIIGGVEQMKRVTSAIDDYIPDSCETLHDTIVEKLGQYNSEIEYVSNKLKGLEYTPC